MSDKTEFLMWIIKMMREHPDWTPDVFSAVAQGSREATDALQEKCGTANFAMLAALTLAETKRISLELRVAMEGAILKAIQEPASPLEREFIQRVAQSRQEEKS